MAASAARFSLISRPLHTNQGAVLPLSIPRMSCGVRFSCTSGRKYSDGFATAKFQSCYARCILSNLIMRRTAPKWKSSFIRLHYKQRASSVAFSQSRGTLLITRNPFHCICALVKACWDSSCEDRRMHARRLSRLQPLSGLAVNTKISLCLQNHFGMLPVLLLVTADPLAICGSLGGQWGERGSGEIRCGREGSRRAYS